jgi:hypothetical protein
MFSEETVNGYCKYTVSASKSNLGAEKRERLIVWDIPIGMWTRSK